MIDQLTIQSSSQPVNQVNWATSQRSQGSRPSQLTKSIKQAHVVFPVALVRKQTWNKMQFIIFEEESLVFMNLHIYIDMGCKMQDKSQPLYV